MSHSMSLRLLACIAVALAGLAAAAPASADKPEHAGGGKAKSEHAGGGGKVDHKHGGKGKSGEHQAAPSHKDGKHESESRFDDDGRKNVQRHYAEQYNGKSCPPGLAKKHNGCQPPGKAKHVYERGEHIPATVVLRPLPDGLRVTLRPLPRGYVYRYVDGQVLVVAEAARKVIDAVVLLSTL